MSSITRYDYWDIVKGLGIIAVVLGHALIFSKEVNYYHLALFFFIAGFFMKEKDCLDYNIFIIKKIKRLWIPFIIYNVIFFLLQNLFVYINLISDSTNGGMKGDYLDKYQLIQAISGVIFDGNVNVMSGATWFISPFLMNILLFAFIIYLSKTNKIYIILCVICFSIFSFPIVNKEIVLPFHIALAGCLLPITLSGYILNKIVSNQILNIKIKYLILAILCICFLEYKDIKISLSEYKLDKWYIFLLASFSGIYVNLYIAKFIEKIVCIKNIFVCIGKHSYDIMALHFIGFKLVTLVYIFIYDKDINLLSLYITDNSYLWKGLYVLFGIITPIIISNYIHYFKQCYTNLRMKLL